MVKEQATFDGRRGGEIEAVQGGTVGGQADFGKRRGEVEAVIWRKRGRVEQQPLLQAIERGQRQQVEGGDELDDAEEDFFGGHLGGWQEDCLFDTWR